MRVRVRALSAPLVAKDGTVGAWRRWKTSTRTRHGPDVLSPPGRSYTPPMRDDLRQFTAANSAQSPNSSLDRLADITDQLRRVSEQRGTGVSVRDRDIPNFNPADDDVEMWLSKLDDYRELYGWDEKYVCHIAVNKFRGSAETWYQTLHTVPKTWGEWKSCGHAIIMLLKISQPTLHCRRIGQSLRDERGYPKNKKHGKNKPTLALFHSCGLRKRLCPESRPTCCC
ncbi:hypothetical protein Zmor_027894 [Zophobas morio]|uniref:Uncharacterized protein n=1 Tax=Zophobas morio TaxID=2755281 RepID=A0AA38HUD8_9CUCU|nr:hypothetical protein Zmor_027894 [Zophobas morio]